MAVNTKDGFILGLGQLFMNFYIYTICISYIYLNKTKQLLFLSTLFL